MGQPTPALDAKPKLGPDLLEIGEAYLELRRAVKFLERCTSSQLIEWAELIGTNSRADRQRIVRLFLACEEVWIPWATEEARKRSGPSEE